VRIGITPQPDHAAALLGPVRIERLGGLDIGKLAVAESLAYAAACGSRFASPDDRLMEMLSTPKLFSVWALSRRPIFLQD
jgi:hypothetical protein